MTLIQSGQTVTCSVCKCTWECVTPGKCEGCERDTLVDIDCGCGPTCADCLTFKGDGVSHYNVCDGAPDDDTATDDDPADDDGPDVNAAIESALTHAPDVDVVLTSYLDALGLCHDVHFYTQAQWEARLEHVGNGAVWSMTAEGPFNHVWNYPNGAWDIEAARGFATVVERLGLHMECGFAWSFHFYSGVAS